MQWLFYSFVPEYLVAPCTSHSRNKQRLPALSTTPPLAMITLTLTPPSPTPPNHRTKNLCAPSDVPSAKTFFPYYPDPTTPNIKKHTSTTSTTAQQNTITERYMGCSLSTMILSGTCWMWFRRITPGG